ncbi:hypothetical protein [Microlunatus flavus]|uniref:Uncharacterized protein n=1 Tax=Microlunatus flavus TaxID=1036181 RepID=A0A1H9I8B1_9ACTN|nr:hypothetical protein [Microlunatus flavus]SEQ70797.1 hypothetical protein SAMN05421756_105127 [Microlunatus flavus]
MSESSHQTSTDPSETSHEPTSRQTSPESQTDGPADMKAGVKPGDSLSELRHPEQNNGITEEEEARRQANVDAAAEQAERLRNAPGHTGRDHL